MSHQGPTHGTSALSRGLRHLMPFQKTATFIVHVKIHDIAKVPLVNGDFQVGWKFRGGKGGSGILGMVNQVKKDYITPKTDLHGGQEEMHAVEPSSPTALSNTSSIYTDDSLKLSPSPTDILQDGGILHHSPVTTSDTHQEGGMVPAPREKKLSQSSGITITSTDTSSTISTSTMSTTHSAPAAPTGNGKVKKTLFNMPHLVESTSSISTARSSLASSSQDDSSPIESDTGTISSVLKGKLQELAPLGQESNHSTEKRGLTPIRSLTSSNDCSWDFTVTQLVKINVYSSNSSSSHLHPHSHGSIPSTTSSIGKPRALSTGWLGGGPHSESGLKIVVFHLPVDSAEHENAQDGKANGHTKRRHKPRVYGFVNLDIAQYASKEAGMGKGGVTRRYLLRQGKTNATIKLTIELEQVAGEANYITPPLQQGQFLAGVTVPGDTSAVMERRIKPASSPSSSSVSTLGGLSRHASSIGTSSVGMSEGYKGSTTSLASIQPNIQPRPQAPPDNHFLKPPNKRHGGHVRHDIFRHGKMQHPHHYHHHYSRQTHSVAPERVIEAIFNPYPSDVPGPFTRPRTPDEVLQSRRALEEQEASRETLPSGTSIDPARTTKRGGHFTGQRIKSAFGVIRPDSRGSHVRDGQNNETKKLEGTLLSDMGKPSRVDGMPADTNKRVWRKHRSNTQDSKTSAGATEQSRPSLDEETGTPRLGRVA